MYGRRNYSKEPEKRRFFPSFNNARVICMILLCAITFGLPIPYFAYAQPMLHFASGTLFTLYGFLVLRDGANLTKNILHTLKVFLIMFVIYGAITVTYEWLMSGNPLAFWTKRKMFNFVVLNYWPESICSTIWYVQSTLYALIVCKLLSFLKKFDWLFCILLFIGAILIGELSMVINFSFLGNQYIPGNFLTRTLPYMLLGRLIYNNYGRLPEWIKANSLLVVAIGLLLSLGEYFGLYYLGFLGYSNHFAGFIVMAAGICIYCVEHPESAIFFWFEDYAEPIYKGMYYTYDPLGYIIIICAPFICKTQAQLYYYSILFGLVTIILTFGVSFFVGFLKGKLKEYDRLNNYDSEEIE